MAEKPPMGGDLTADEIAAIRYSTIDRIEQLGDSWRDDHIDCVAVRVWIHYRDEPIDTSLWWCGPEIIGALRYWKDSQRAKQDLIKELRSH